MAIEAELPDGRILEFPDGTDPGVIQSTVKRVLASGRQSTIGSELVRGGKQLASSIRTGVEALGASPEEAARRGVARGQEIATEAGEGVSLDAVKRAYAEKGLLSAAGEAVSQIPRALAGQGAQLGTMAAGARLGAMAGSALAPGVGTVVGGALGAGATLLPQFFGSNVERQAAEQMEKGQPVAIDRTKAGAAAAGQAAIEGAGTAFVLGKRAIKGVLGIAEDAALTTAKAQQELVKTAQRSLTGAAGRGALRGATEMPVEIAQQVLERAQAGLDLTSPEAFTEYGESAYQAALVGGPLGAAGNVYARGKAKEQVETQEAAQRAEEAQRAADAAKAAQVPKLPLATAPGAQGELFGPETAPRAEAPETDLFGEPVKRPKGAPEAPAAAMPQPGQEDLGLDYQREVEQLYLERERLRKGAQTPEAKERIADLTTKIRQYEEMSVAERRAQAELEAEEARADRAARTKFPALAEAPSLWDYSEGARSRVQGELFEEPGGPMPTEPTAAEPEPEGPTPVPPYKRTGPYQYKLRAPQGRPTPANALTMKDVEDTGIAPATTRDWFEQNVVGKTREDVQALVDKDPGLIAGPGKRAKILRELLAPQPATFEETTDAETGTETPAAIPRAKPRASKPRVGVPVEPGRAVDLGPDAGMAGPTGGTEAPDGLGLVPSEQPAGAGVETQGEQLPAVDPFGALVQATEAKPDLVEEPAAAPVASKSPFDWEGQPSKLGAQIQREADERRKSVSPMPGQSLASLQSNIESASGPLGAALRQMLKSGKVVLADKDPEGQNAGGLFDGKRVTLYADGIPAGHELAVALHEVAAHLGLRRLLGDAQYEALIDRILEMAASPTASPERALAQRSMARIPEADRQRGADVARDEAVAYYIEELALAESRGELPKAGPLRTTWAKIKSAIVTALNKALGTNFAVSSFTPHDIAALAQAAFVSESKTGVDDAGPVKRQFSISPSSEAIIDRMGALDPQDKRGLVQSVKGFIAGSSPAEPSYATKFRTQVADVAATVEERLRTQFDGAVRDNLGKLNPMGLYRQAQDHAKLLLEFFQVGGLVKDPATGLWAVQQKPGVRAPADVYPALYAWGEKNGYSKDRATQLASKILEANRLHELVTANPDFPAHIPRAELAELVRDYKADPDLQALNKLMDESRIAMVDNMVKVGRLTKETGDAWKDALGYVPFDRLEDKDFDAAFSKIKKISNKGIAQVGKLPELVGSLKRPVGNVFDNYINTLGWMVGQTMKTDGTVTTLRALEDIGIAKFLHGTKQGKPNTVGMYVGGEMKYWEVPSKYDVVAFNDLTVPKAGWIKALSRFSNVLRTSVTALPPFALKQVTDDVQRAIMTSGVKNPGALLRMSLANFGSIAFAELRGIQHPSVREFGKLGLTGEFDFQAGKPATSLLKDLGYKKRGKAEALLHRLEGITRASDLAVRKAIYDQTIKETNDALLAQTRAREFINFRRRGASDFVGAMVTTIPFFNAYIQGMDVLYRAASGKDSSSSIGRAQARRMFWSRATTVMMLSSLYALGKDEDDERYKEMDLRTRDSNWIIGDYKLPVPGELGALFKVIPERVVEYMRRQGTPEEQTAWEATRTALTYIFEQYVGRTVPVPQAVKPLLEAWTNYSFFTGRELEGIYQKQQDPSLRRASNTSELAIAIANFARDTVGVDKVSPILVDNALNGYFGSSAGLLVAMTDSLLNPTRVDRPLHKWALISNYMYDPVGTRRMTEFYEEREKVGRANATLNELAKTDLDRAAKYAEENAEKLALEGAVNSTLEQLERTRAYRKYLNSPDAAKEMPKEERESELQELRKIEVDLTGWLREAKASLR